MNYIKPLLFNPYIKFPGNKDFKIYGLAWEPEHPEQHGAYD